MNIEIDLTPTDYSIRGGELPPSFSKYAGQESFFEGKPPLPLSVGYLIVLGFGLIFSLATTALVYLNKKHGGLLKITSEFFNTAGRMTKTGLTASVIVSNWTWAATLLQSSNVAYQYGVSGPFWYASGATIQILLFGVLAIKLKKIAPSAHTVAEIVNVRYGRSAHITYLFFFFATNIIVTSMLLLGGAATVNALTGMDYRIASFLIPWGVILYTASGGLQATFLTSYIHTVIIFVVLVVMIFLVYFKSYSSDQIYDLLVNTANKTPEQCEALFSNDNGSFFDPDIYSCGPVPGNRDGSYLTMLSIDGLKFGLINIVGNFGTVFVDQSYWQSAIAARPQSAGKGYFLGGLCWFSIPFALATSLGLASTALMLPITATEAGEGLVPPAVATHLLGTTGSVLILIMLFMAIVSTGSAESMAVASLVSYDIYREYFNPNATGEQILFVSRVTIIVFGLFMGVFSIALHEIGLNLGWVYLFMGVIIGSAVIPLWNMLTWDRASGKGAVIAAWGGLVIGVVVWLFTGSLQTLELSVESLGTNEVMLAGNLGSILASGSIHWFWSKYVEPQHYDFEELDKHITLVEDDFRGIQKADLDPLMLEEAETWITRRSWSLTFVMIIFWPILSIPAGVFSKSYFAFWVLISVAWGVGAAIAVTYLPISENWDDISRFWKDLHQRIISNKEELKKSKDCLDATRGTLMKIEIPSECDEESGATEANHSEFLSKTFDDIMTKASKKKGRKHAMGVHSNHSEKSLQSLERESN